MPNEHQEQVAVVQWAALAVCTWPELDALYAIPNGGNRDGRVGKHMKDEGARAGVPDLHLPVARGGHHSLYVEMKRRDGGRTSAEQREWAERLSRYGNLVVTCNGADEAIQTIERYLAGLAQLPAAVQPHELRETRRGRRR